MSLRRLVLTRRSAPPQDVSHSWLVPRDHFLQILCRARVDLLQLVACVERGNLLLVRESVRAALVLRTTLEALETRSEGQLSKPEGQIWKVAGERERYIAVTWESGRGEGALEGQLGKHVKPKRVVDDGEGAGGRLCNGYVTAM